MLTARKEEKLLEDKKSKSALEFNTKVVKKRQTP
jgi:hypothetical protein